MTKLSYIHTDFLVKHPFFDSLSSIQKSTLSSNARFRTLTKGNVIYHADHPNQLYLLKAGTLKLGELDKSGAEHTKEVLWDGELFGGVSYSSFMEHDEYAVVISPTAEIYQIPPYYLESLLKDNFGFTSQYMAEIARRVEKLESRYRNFARLTDAKTRLIHLIKQWAQVQGVFARESKIVENFLTHQDIASLICTTRVTVTNILNELRQQHVIRYNKHSIELLCPEVFGKTATLKVAS